MYRFLLILLGVFALISTPSLNAQPQVNWANLYHDNEDQDWLYDVYAAEDGGYASCGMTTTDGNENGVDVWLLKTDSRGEEEFSISYSEMDGQVHEWGYTLIQADDGGYVIGGLSMTNGSDMVVIRTDEFGEMIWANRYGGDDFDQCNAVIELKNGNFLLAGETRSFGEGRKDGWLVCIDGDGEIVWDATHGTAVNETFEAIREVDEGVMVAGRQFESHPQHDFWLVRVNEVGEMIWEQNFGAEDHSEILMDMTSCRDGGFILGGATTGWLPYLVRVNNQGEALWDTYLEDDFVFVSPNVGSVAQLPDLGFVYVSAANTSTIVIRTDAAGNFAWSHINNLGSERVSYFNSVVPTPAGGITAAGMLRTNGLDDEGLIAQFHPDVSSPTLINFAPETLEFSVLQGDSIEFFVEAFDFQDDEILYCWTVDDDTVSTDSSVTIVFPDLGDPIVKCRLSDEAPGDSIQWQVHVREFYIQSFQPEDTELTVRRRTEVDFTHHIRAIEDIELDYRWEHFGRGGNFELDGGDSIRFEFDLTGEHIIRAFVMRDDEIESIEWDVNVRSILWWWWPHETEISIPEDTTLVFEVFPFNEESDSLEYSWRLGNRLLDNETSSIELSFPEVNQYQLLSIVREGIEVDTIHWTVDVLERNFTADNTNIADLPTSPILYPACPNPFNSSVCLSFYLPGTQITDFSIYDLNGRIVQQLINSQISEGNHQIIWDASNISTGIYFAVLFTPNNRFVKKVVLTR